MQSDKNNYNFESVCFSLECYDMKKQKIYKIYTAECSKYTGGSLTVEEMAEAFTDVDDISYLDGDAGYLA